MARRIKVSILNFYRSGIYQYGAELANSLSERDCAIQHLTTSENNLSIVRSTEHLTTVVIPSPIVLSQFLIQLLNPLFLWRFYRALHSFPADILYVNDLHPLHIFAVGFYRLTRPRTAIVLTLHDPTPHHQEKFSWYWRLSVPFLTRSASQIIVHGHNLKAAAIKTWEIAPEKLTVIPLGIYPVYTKHLPQQTPAPTPVALFFGRIQHYKGPDLLINAAVSLLEQGHQFKVLFAGEGGDELEKSIPQKWRNAFEFKRGFIPEEDVPALFDAATIVVMPYREATQSGVLPIALCRGKATVVTAVGALTEVVKDGKNGLLVQPNVSAIAQGMKQLIESPSLRQKIEKGAKETVENLRWENVTKDYRNVFKLCLDTRPELDQSADHTKK